MFSEYKEKSDNNTMNNDIFPLRYYSPIATRFGCIICLVPGRVDPDCGESAQTSGQPVCRSFVNLGRCPGRGLPVSGSVPITCLVVSW